MNKYIDYKIIIFVFTLCLLHNKAFCQNENLYSISGTMVDKNKSACEFYILTLYSLKDSLKVDETLTDETGKFVFADIKSNSYFIKARFFTSEKIIIPLISVEQRNLNFGEIVFDLQEFQLTEVEVKSIRPVLKRNADHVYLKVKDSYLSESAFEIFEIMNLIPNVNASPEGIKIKNSAGILYLIDGKGNRNTNEINKQRILNLSNKDIDRIEVYSNPPARFDADGASVINVITVKNVKVSTVYSTNKIGLWQNNPKSNSLNLSNGVNLNYRIGNFGIYSNLEHGFSQEVQSYESQTTFNTSNKSFDNIITKVNTSPAIRLNSGIIYKINDKNEVIVEYRHDSNRFGDSSRLKSDNYLSFYTKNNIDSVLYKQLLANTGFSFNNLNIGYWSNNKYFNYDLQLYFDGYSTGTSGSGYSGININYFSNINENNYGAMLNIQDSILKNVEFRTGLKYTQTISEEFIDNEINKGLYIYRENLKAIYAQLSGNIFSIDWMAGFRIESTDWKIDVPENRNGMYANLFPSVFFSKNFKNYSISASYSKRIQRQDISELNPNLKIDDKILTSQYGNVEQLKPRLFDSYELNFDFSFVTISTYFNRTKNPRVYYPVNIDTLLVTYVPQSAAYENTYGINLKVPLNLGAFRINFSWNSDIIKSALISKETKTGYSNFAMINANYSINKNLVINGSVRYSLPENYNYLQSKSNWVAYFGLGYQKQNSPFMFRLNIIDVFGRKYNTTYTYPLISEKNFNISLQRALQLSVRYNFKLGKEFNQKSFDGLNR